MLAVAELREQIRAGFGRASFQMRILDNVSLTVHAGELVVVRGDSGSGASALRAVLAGTRVVRSGVRRVTDGVAVRHATIPCDALLPLLEGWSATPRASRSTVAEVFVLRVRPSAAPERNRIAGALGDGPLHDRWRAWAASLRARRGGMVLHVPWTTDLGLPDDERPTYAEKLSAAKRASPRVHEGVRAQRRFFRTLPQSDAASVRTITLVGGRVVGAVPSTPTLIVRSGAGVLPRVGDPSCTNAQRQE